MATSGWKPPKERLKAPKGTKIVHITWAEFHKLDLTIMFTKWEADELLVKRGKKMIFRLPNGTYGVKK